MKIEEGGCPPRSRAGCVRVGRPPTETHGPDNVGERAVVRHDVVHPPPAVHVCTRPHGEKFDRLAASMPLRVRFDLLQGRQDLVTQCIEAPRFVVDNLDGASETRRLKPVIAVHEIVIRRYAIGRIVIEPRTQCLSERGDGSRSLDLEGVRYNGLASGRIDRTTQWRPKNERLETRHAPCADKLWR